MPTKSEEKLWDLLDEIDTLSDKIKPRNLEGYIAFYKRAIELSMERHKILTTDGYVLSYPKGK